MALKDKLVNLEDLKAVNDAMQEQVDHKAEIDGYYQDMTVGDAEQLISSKYVENSEPYTFRTSGGTSDIGNREYLDAVVGGTLAWNQIVRDEASENSTDFAPIVTVTDAVEDAAGVKVKIEPVQDLHGYDHPWPAGGGKNVLNANLFTRTSSTEGNQISVSDEIITMAWVSGGIVGTNRERQTISAGTYTISATGTNTNYVYARIDAVDSSGTITAAILNVSKTFTAEKDFYISLYGDYNNHGTAVFKLQLESGSTATSWTPYSNICPISGWDGVKVTRCGINVLDDDWEVGSISNTTGLPTGTDPNNIRTKNYISVRPGTAYYFYNATGANIRYYWYDEEKTFISGNIVSSNGGVLTSPANAYWLKIRTTEMYGTTFKNDIAVNYPSTDRTYHAGNVQSLSITLPTEAGTVYGGELTVNADGSGSLVVDRASVDMGALTWGLDGNNAHRFLAYNSVSAKPTGNYSVPVNSICNMYKSLSQNALFNSTVGLSIQSMNGKSIYVYDDKYTDSAAFKAALQASNAQLVYELAEPTTYTLTASQVRTLLGQNNVWADTGDLALTYTGTDEHLTLESGKKYLARLSGTDSMLLGSGQEITAAKGTDNVFDLTQMFGTAVADYVYGQGASFFRKWFGKTWYPYNAGELKHVEGLSAHEMVGFNQWDEQWELGTIRQQDGAFVNDNTRIRSKNYNPCVPNAVYYVEDPTNGNNIAIRWYDADKNFVSASGWLGNTTIQAPENAYYFAFVMASSYGTTYKHDICINLSHNGSRNGEYEPYEKHSYPLDSTVVLRGIPKVGANGVYWDGDRYLPDGTVERRYGVVDLGTLDWSRDGVGYFQSVFVSDTKRYLSDAVFNGICTKYTNLSVVGVTDNDLSIGIYYSNSNDKSYVRIRDNFYNDATAFKAAMSGVLLVYELAEPTTETAQPYHSTQWVSDWGTEEFVSTGLVPVGTETRYPANLRDKLQHLPDAASGNGSYLITQTDGQMVLTPFPAPPSTAGNYVLKATVTGGVATYTWEVAT